ncbi:MAG TPA: transaldolase family protein, partial [Kineosporiaceae bacterium]|nr:transaldolase family protein [Kineosporiaceae bacterium]
MSDVLADLSRHGVSVWLDDLSRELIDGGELSRLIDSKHIVGVTTNPTIFASALAKGDRYTDQMSAFAERGATVENAVFEITTDDVRSGADVLRPVYDATDGLDGRVSIEV